jgi:TonB family protein
MQYLFLVATYTAVMQLIYFLFLRNKSAYALSRYYLLACAVLPAALPLLTFPHTAENVLLNTVYLRVDLPAVTVSTAQKIENIEQSFPMIWAIYCTVVTFFIARLLSQMANLRRVIRNGKTENRESYTLVTGTGYGPGSFGRYIILPAGDINETIIAHEQAHIRFRHTADILLVNLAQALLWPNIFLYWIKRELRQVHEFQADAAVDTTREEYTQLLLGTVFNTSCVPIMHSFIIHPVKRRIMMLQKKGDAISLKAGIAACSMLVLFIALAICIQSCSRNTTNVPQKSNPPFSFHLDSATPVDVRQKADVMPEFKGGSDSLVAFLSREIKYPDEARTKNIEGKVVVKFIVMNDGSVAVPTIVRSPDTSLSKAALELIRKMPKWEPAHMNNGEKVSVAYYLPVLFKLKS